MRKFPEPIPLPQSVIQKRELRCRHMKLAARKGIALRVLIILAEIIGYAYFNSSVLLFDALSSLVDVASSLFLLFSIHYADKPPDEDHPFGHGRLEPIAGLQLSLMLAVVGAGMLFLQLSTLTSGGPPKGIISTYTWLIPLGAVVLLELCYRLLKYTAKRENSPALLADALHFRIDGVNSLIATAALGLGALFPFYSHFFDHCGAIFIALFMIVLGVYAARGNYNQLTDRLPDEKYFDLVRTSVQRVPGVQAIEKIRIQIYGPDAHVNIDVEVKPSLSVEEGHAIAQKVRGAIQKDWPAVRDAIVHIEPFYPEDHLS